MAAQAKDASGKVLATSPAVPTSYTPPGRGYYLSTQTGNVYNFDAPLHGSLASTHRKPAGHVVGTVVPPTRSGYYLPSSAGAVYNFGAPFYGSLTSSGRKPISGNRPGGVPGRRLLPGHLGGRCLQLWKSSVRRLTTKVGHHTHGSGVRHRRRPEGGVLAGRAGWRGAQLRGPLVRLRTRPGASRPRGGIAAEPDGGGYLLVTAKGNVYPFGDAAGHGSPATSVLHLPSPVVGIATQQATAARQQPTGYYVVCANEDVYNYGMFLPGSPNGLPLPAPIDGVGAN